MFGIGMPEMIMILVIALIVLGPQKLPELAKSLGRAVREFKKATSELKESLEIDTEVGDVKKAFDTMNQDIKKSIDAAPEKTSSQSGNESEKTEKKEAPESSAGGQTSPAEGRPHD